MRVDDFADVLWSAWHKVYGYAGDIDFETFRAASIAKYVPETKDFPEAGPTLDRIFVEYFNDLLEPFRVKVAAFTPMKYRAYRKDGKKTWDDLAVWLTAAQKRA